MADNYAGNMLQSRAIYPSTFMPYILLLVGSKFFRSFAIFLTYDILKLIHVVQFLFIVKSGSSLILIFLQKPFSTGKRITKHQWFRISQHAFAGCAIQILWLFGLTLCGPLRTLMLYEHSDIVIIAAISALFTNTSSPSKFRGAVFLLIAVMGLLLFDHDFLRNHMRDHPDIHRDSSILTHLFDHLTDLTGLSDHKGGVILLFCTLCLNVGYNSAAKKLSVDVGGAKRLHALSSVVSTLLLFPWALFVFFTRESRVDSWFFLVFSMFVFIILVFVVDYYIESVCSQRLESLRAARFGAMATFISGLALSCFWNHPLVSRITSVNQLRDVIAEDHMLSGGVVFSFILIMFATYILTSASRGSKGSLIGYSAAGLPLYSFTGDAIQRTSHSIFNVAKSGLKQILEDSNSRKIFYFLCVNLSFTFVELIYGAWTNSLGLISDGFHMLFDCSALVMGLYAAVMSRWPATRIFSYGYDRVEILSGFINGLFLMVIAFFVFSAACTRLVDPPDIKTERLLAVSVAGLLVNLVGIVAFQNSLPHGHSHGHSHGSKSHSHAHGHSHAELDHNTNMQGVFLHVLADTLGSVGVIISTLLIERFGWKVADPICSLFIGTLTFMSVLPLVKETVLILLLRTPVDIQRDLGITLQKLLSLEGVISYRDEHIWRHSSKVVCGTIHVQVKPDSSEQHIITQVSALLKDVGVTNLTVQVEKEAYFLHMSGFGVTIDQVYETTKHVKLLNYENPAANFIKAI